jgi:hypothetical protein
MGPETDFLTDVFHSLSQSLQANIGIVPQTRQRPLPSTLVFTDDPAVRRYIRSVSC